MKHNKNKKSPEYSSLYHKIADFLRGNALFILVLTAAFLFRFLFITKFPGGLFPDEAANGLDVNAILRGELQPFYERGNGREALFFYLLAIPVSLFGPGVWQHHIVSATLGFFAVIAIYLLARRMFDKNIALVAAFLAAISSFFTVLSRTAFRAITIPLLTSLTIFFLVKAYQAESARERIWSAIAAGVCFGLGFYTYISFRMMPVLLAGLLIILLIANRHRLKELLSRWWKSAAAFVLSFLASFFWLLYYFITHPGSFIGRAGQVSIFNPDLNEGNLVGTFLGVFWDTMKSFFTEGDLNWRHNVSGQPFLDGFSGVFFAFSLIVFTLAAFAALWQAWNKRLKETTFYMMLIAAWFWLMLLPEITTAEGIPHGLRLIGIIPALFILPAWGISKFWQMIKAKINHPDNRLALAIVFFFAIFAYNFILYFGKAASSPDYYYAFRSDLTLVSEYLNERNNKEQTYLSLDAFSVQTVEYLTSGFGQPYQLVIPEKTFEVGLGSGDQVIFTQSTLFDRLKFLEHHPETELTLTKKNQFGEIIMLVYQQP